MLLQISVDPERLAHICRRYHVRRLSAFGSVLREDFGPASDVDLLIEFDPEHVPGMVAMDELEHELWDLTGRRVDIVNPKYLNHRIRDRVLAEAELQYAEG